MRQYLLFPLFIFICLGCSTVEENSSKDNQVLFLPDDLEATLWAESPMFFNPTNMDVDVRGRIWVTEAVNYRNFNNDSTKVLHHGKGDRIMILEDTDGDGVADDSKVFVQDKDLVSPLGIAVIGNRIFVSCSPNLIVYTDNDGDDKPDHKEILLTGFGGLDHDHSLHAIVGGPDGNLYFNTGNAGPHVVTDKSGWTLRSGSIYNGGSPYNVSNKGSMKSDDGRIYVGGLALRIDPQGNGLKVLGHNFRNSFELAIDSRGDMWQNDNDDQVVACRTTWLMEGGNAGYFNNDGTRFWQADQRPWQDVFTAHWHQDDPGVMPAGDNAGAGSPTGVAVNESDALGKQYRGLLLSADAGRNVIFGYYPKGKRSGYDLGKRMNFLTSLKEDNIGYVWNDSVHKTQTEKWFRPSDVTIGTDGAIYVADWHDPVVGGHQMHDSTGYGRIYRITPKAHKLTSPKINLSTNDGMLQALLSPAVNVRYTARERLKAKGAEIIPALKKILDDENPFHQARAIWLLSALGEPGRVEVERLLDSDVDDIRMVAFRALRQATDNIIPYAERLVSDRSPFVRREVIVALTDVPYEKKKDLLLKLLDSYDPEDRWYLEAFGRAVSGNESEIYSAYKKTTPDATPAKWNTRLASLSWRLHPPSAAADLKIRAASGEVSESDRLQALTALSFINTPGAVRAMMDLSKSENKTIAEQATYWLSFRQSNDWFALWDWNKSGFDAAHERKVSVMKVKRTRILDETMPFDERKWNARDMAIDPVGANMLLGLLAEKKLPEILYPVVEEYILKNTDPSVQMQASLHFKKTSGGDLVVGEIMKIKGSADAGKTIFNRTCSSCHRVQNTGHDVGPDLSLINKKFTHQALLDNIVHPDAGIVFGYEAWTINHSDGQSFFGFLVADGDQTVTIKDLSGKLQNIPTAKITSRKKAEGSLMPEPAQLGLSKQDLADLMEYLMNVE